MPSSQGYALDAYNLYQSLEPYITPVRNFAADVQVRAWPLVLPVLHKVAAMAQESPAAVSFAVLLVSLYVVWKVMNFVRRILAFGIRLFFNMLILGIAVVTLAAVWERGVGKTADDLINGFQTLSEVWWGEYRKWEGYQNQRARAAGTMYR